MAFLKIDKALYSTEYSDNKNIKPLNNSALFVYSVIHEYNSQGKPLVMGAKRMAEAANVAPSTLRRVLSEFDDAGILVKKPLQGNARNLNAFWVAPVPEVLTALTKDGQSTWSERNNDLQPLPELLPPTMQAHAFATQGKPAAEKRHSVNGVFLPFNDEIVSVLWTEFLAQADTLRGGNTTIKAAQWLANPLKECRTAKLAAFYLSYAIDNGMQVLKVGDTTQQSQDENKARKVYESAAGALLDEAAQQEATEWREFIELARDEFAGSSFFSLFEGFKFEKHAAGSTHLRSQDAEQIHLYETLVPPAFFNLLRQNGVQGVNFEFGTVNGVPVLASGKWESEKAEYKRITGKAYDVIEHLKADKIEGFENWLTIEATEQDEAPGVVLPFGNNFAEAWAEWMEYRQEEHGITYGESEEIRALFRVQLNFISEAAAVDAIHTSIANGYTGLTYNAPKRKEGNSPAANLHTEESQKKLQEFARTGVIAGAPVL